MKHNYDKAIGQFTPAEIVTASGKCPVNGFIMKDPKTKIKIIK